MIQFVVLQSINGDDRILDINNSRSESNIFINKIRELVINDKVCPIFMSDEVPTDESPDGYYLIKCDDDKFKCDIYHKKTEINQGYFYTSASININNIGFVKILLYQNGENIFQLPGLPNNKIIAQKNNNFNNDLNYDKRTKLINELKKRLCEYNVTKKKEI